MKTVWPKIKLGEVLSHRKEFITIDDLTIYKRPRVQLHAQGIVLRDEIPGALIKTKTQQVCRTGEFLVAEIDAKVGGFGIVPPALDGSIVSSHYFLFSVEDSKLDRRYLDYYIRTPSFREQVEAQGSTNYAAIRPAHVLGYEIPLPPLPVQRRVIARIEELAAQIQEASILQREAAEEADALVGTVANRLFSGQSNAVPIEAVADIRGGIQKGPHRTPGANPVRYLTVAHVQRNRISTDDPRFFEVSPAELNRWRLESGDVLIIEGNGSAEQIGRAALFRGEIEDCVHQNHVIRIRPDATQIAPEFLNAFLNSPAGQDAVQAQSRTTSGLRTLSVGRIRQIKVPVPPLAQQQRVLGELNALQGEVDALKRLQTETAAELGAMLPAILDRAFKGEL
jgi:type I restriction enzyme, S subunit